MSPRSSYATGPITKPPDWHGLVAWDVWLNNLTTGLFLVTAVCDLAAPALFGSTARLAYPVALALVLADLVLLVLDLGDPLRFHHMLRVFKPSSPMSLGVWSLSAYAFVLTLISLLGLTTEGWQWARQALVVIGLVPALASLVYKGVLFSTSAQPVWRDSRWLGGYLTSAALALGCAELLALSVLLGQEKAVNVLRPGLVVLLVLGSVPLLLLLTDVRPALAGPHGRRLGRGCAIAVGLGSLLPLGLLMASASSASLLTAVSFVVVGALFLRFLLVKLPHALGPREH